MAYGETPEGRSAGADDSWRRVSDTERERAESQLRWSFTHGILSLEEFTSRLDTVWAACIRADLNVAVFDLPGGVAWTRPEHEQLVLRGTGVPIKRQGQWKAPRQLLIYGAVGFSTKLDFTEARIDFPEIEIVLDITTGAVELVVPRSATVNADEIQVAVLNDRRRGVDASRNGPHFRLIGRVDSGLVEIRRPRYWRIGQLEIRFPWKL